jgi:hypothetical protein
MTRDDLFRGLLAALRENGVKFIDTQNDAQHSSFRRVVGLLQKCQGEFPNIPFTFVPSPFTGRYRELDDALLRLQRGFLGARNPFYAGVNLNLSEDRAKRILNGYSPEDQELFSRLAAAFLNEDAAIGHST